MGVRLSTWWPMPGLQPNQRQPFWRLSVSRSHETHLPGAQGPKRRFRIDFGGLRIEPLPGVAGEWIEVPSDAPRPIPEESFGET